MAQLRFVAALLVGAATACAAPTDPIAVPTPTTTQAPATALRVGVARSITTIDPAYASDLDAQRVARMLYDGLTAIDPTSGDVVEALATDWSTTDNRTWTFTLDADVWSDGSRVTAQDVVRGLTHAAYPDGVTRGPLFGLLRNIAGAEASKAAMQNAILAVDEQTVRITLDQPDASFPHLVSHPGLAPRHPAAGDALDGLIPTNGAYVASDLAPDDGFLRLVAAAAGPHPDAVLILTYAADPRGSVLLADARDGVLDIAPVAPAVAGLATAEIASAGRATNWAGLHTPPRAASRMLLIRANSPADSPRIKATIAQLANRDTAASAWDGLARPATTLRPVTSLPLPARCTICVYSPVGALVTYRSGPALAQPLRLLTPATVPDVAAAQQIAEAALRLGLVIDVSALPLRAYTQAVAAGEGDIVLYGWTADHLAPAGFLRHLADDAGLAASVTGDGAAGAVAAAATGWAPAATAQADEAVIAQLDVIPLVDLRTGLVTTAQTTGLRLDARGLWDPLAVRKAPQ